MRTIDTRRRFTGYHMAAILVAFFGVIIAVNMVMATLATRTFGGVVVENSYVASQEFNGWLKDARVDLVNIFKFSAVGLLVVGILLFATGARQRRRP